MEYIVTIKVDTPMKQRAYKKACDEFMEAYNQFANYNNLRYDKWNKEYEALGLPNDGVDENNCVRSMHESKYNQFIFDKYKPIVNRINRGNRSRYIDEFYVAEDELDFRAKLKNGSDMYMSISKK